MSRIVFKVLTFRVIVKEVLFKVLPQIQRRQWRKKWNLFISDGGNFRRQFCSPFARSPRACNTRCTICAKNSTVGYFNGTNPITGKDIQLRSPTPIMAPGVYHNVTSVKVLLFLQVRLWNVDCMHLCCERNSDKNLFFSFSNCLAAATLPRSLFLPFSDSLASRRNEHCLKPLSLHNGSF